MHACVRICANSIVRTGSNATAIGAGAAFTGALLSNGEIFCWGDNSFGQLGIGNTEDVGSAPDEMGLYLAPANLSGGLLRIAVLNVFVRDGQGVQGSGVRSNEWVCEGDAMTGRGAKSLKTDSSGAAIGFIFCAALK